MSGPLVMLALITAILGAEVASGADSGPQPPCGAEAFPIYPNVSNSPAVKVWDRSELGSEWTPPACTGWSESGFSTLVVTVARFRYTSGAEGLLRKIGAISEATGMRYWSTTHKQWQTLIVEAYAVTGLAGDRRRQDFSLDEIAQGQPQYFHQEDNLSGKAIYRMRVVSASPDRIVFGTENISTVKYLLVTLFPPGEMQAIYFLERESQDIWRYYSIARTGKKASSLTAGHEASSVNRAVAYYRYMIGVPTDTEPPAAR